MGILLGCIFFLLVFLGVCTPLISNIFEKKYCCDSFEEELEKIEKEGITVKAAKNYGATPMSKILLYPEKETYTLLDLFCLKHEYEHLFQFSRSNKAQVIVRLREVYMWIVVPFSLCLGIIGMRSVFSTVFKIYFAIFSLLGIVLAIAVFRMEYDASKRAFEKCKNIFEADSKRLVKISFLASALLQAVLVLSFAYIPIILFAMA